MAVMAGHLAHVPGEALATRVGVRLEMPSSDERDGAFVACRVGAVSAVPVSILDGDRVASTVQNRVPNFCCELLPRSVQIEPERVAECTEKPLVVTRHRRIRPRLDGTFAQRLRRVRNDQVRIDLHPGAET